MASTFNASAVTSTTSPKQVHAGVNYVVSSYTLAQTASGSYTLNMYPLPGGARVVDVTVAYSSPIEGGAGTNGLISIRDSEGNTYAASASAANGIRVSYAPDLASLGVKLSASANLQISLSAFGGTGTSQTAFTLTASYTADEEANG